MFTSRVSPPGGRAGGGGARRAPTPGWRPGTAVPPGEGLARSALPGEHGFRFFPGFYKHVVDTMGRIPYKDGVVADNLVDTTRVHIARFDQPRVVLPARFAQTPGEIKLELVAALRVISAPLDISQDETVFMAGK